MYLDIYKYLLSLHTTVWPDFCFEKWEPAIFGPGFCFKFRMIIDSISIIIFYSNCIFDQTRVCTMDKTRVKNEKKNYLVYKEILSGEEFKMTPSLNFSTPFFC